MNTGIDNASKEERTIALSIVRGLLLTLVKLFGPSMGLDPGGVCIVPPIYPYLREEIRFHMFYGSRNSLNVPRRSGADIRIKSGTASDCRSGKVISDVTQIEG